MSLIRNLGALRNIPVFGSRLVEALSDIQQQLSNLSVQGNGSLSGTENSPPPQVNAVSVNASGGVAHVQITDSNENLYRGVRYHVQYATDPGFSAPITHHMGPSRDARIPVGTQPLYYRVFSDYPTSTHSDPVYHGGSNPTAVAAIGTEQPAIPSGAGSGTGTPSQISGYGPVQWRGTNPPKRS
jgi:hypothetical protein